jgi:hypothetical protein
MGGIVLSKRLGLRLGKAEAPAMKPIFSAPLFALPSMNQQLIFFFQQKTKIINNL